MYRKCDLYIVWLRYSVSNEHVPFVFSSKKDADTFADKQIKDGYNQVRQEPFATFVDDADSIGRTANRLFSVWINESKWVAGSLTLFVVSTWVPESFNNVEHALAGAAAGLLGFAVYKLQSWNIKRLCKR